MLTVTDVAAEKALEVLEAEGKPEWGIRIFSSGSSCCGPSFGMDIEEKPTAEDEVHEHKGLKVFATKEIAPQLAGLTIDFVDDGQQQGFVMRDTQKKPSAGGCGCSSGSCH
jgi:iron-sulfur cluster assembly accessory protein